jgi:hypothetical protein
MTAGKTNSRLNATAVSFRFTGEIHAGRSVKAAVEKHARAVRESLGVYLPRKDLTALKNAGRR